MSFNNILFIKIPKLLNLFSIFLNTKVIKSRNLKFKILSNNWITKYRGRTFNEKEPDTLDWVDSNLKDDDYFFDIGANIGIYSLYAYKKNKNANIVAFEPEFSNLDQLKNNIIINKAIQNIKVFGIALSDETNLSYLHIQDFTPGSALHTESTKDIKITKNGKKVIFKEGIATYKLDDIVKITGMSPNLIKIDVDGNEIKILNGAKNTLKNKNLRSIIIEIEDHSNDDKIIKELLEENGFKFFSKRNYNQIWNRK